MSGAAQLSVRVLDGAGVHRYRDPSPGVDCQVRRPSLAAGLGRTIATIANLVFLLAPVFRSPERNLRITRKCCSSNRRRHPEQLRQDIPEISSESTSTSNNIERNGFLFRFKTGKVWRCSAYSNLLL